jgi:hypothetical protein
MKVKRESINSKFSRNIREIIIKKINNRVGTDGIQIINIMNFNSLLIK